MVTLSSRHFSGWGICRGSHMCSSRPCFFSLSRYFSSLETQWFLSLLPFLCLPQKQPLTKYFYRNILPGWLCWDFTLNCLSFLLVLATHLFSKIIGFGFVLFLFLSVTEPSGFEYKYTWSLCAYRMCSMYARGSRKVMVQGLAKIRVSNYQCNRGVS